MRLSSEVSIEGTSEPAKPQGSIVSISHEENGSLSTPTEIPLSQFNTRAWTTCHLGDGAYGIAGTGSGDFDLFAIRSVPAGTVLIADVDTPGLSADPGLDSSLALFSGAGDLLSVNDDDGRSSDSRLFVVVPSTGDYFFAIGGTGLETLSDPSDPSSGPGAGTEGSYDLFFQWASLATQAAENNGSISQATTVVVSEGSPKIYQGIIGDGPHGASGTGSGDFDFFRLQLAGGTLLNVDINADVEGSVLNSVLALWDSTGNIIATNDNEPGTTDSLLSLTIPRNGTYYVSVGGAGAAFPSDPFDSASGPGSGSQGAYTILFEVPFSDSDFFRLRLRAGDVFGASSDNDQSELQLINFNNEVLVSSGGDNSSKYPSASPLPGGFGPTLSAVIPSDGVYFFKTDGLDTAPYAILASVRRPRMELTNPGVRQTLFVDFDGATLDTTPIGGPGVRSLSPMSNFLGAWGLTGANVDAVVNTALGEANRLLRTNLSNGTNPFFALNIRNSRDHGEQFGNLHVTRVIVGGTQSESGLTGISFAQSVDPGNFATTETGLVLLDRLSGPPSDDLSLNGVDVGTTKVNLVGKALGRLIAHEAGHLFGGFDTQPLSLPSAMDNPNNLANLLGLGEDNTFGTGDDEPVSFGIDYFGPAEGFSGRHDTLNTAAWGLTTRPSGLFVQFRRPTDGSGSIGSPFKFLSSAVAAASPGDAVRIFAGTSSENFVGATRINKPMTLLNHTPGLGNVVIGQ